MSHIVTIQVKIHDAAAITAACQRLGCPRRQRARRSYSAARSPEWPYSCPAGCIQSSPILATGQVEVRQLQTAGGATSSTSTASYRRMPWNGARGEARREGLVCTEQALADGSIKLTFEVQGGAA